MHRLWQGYIQEVLGLDNTKRRGPLGSPDAAKLCSADFHGAEVEVVRSRCVSRVGVRGIIVKDSMRAFDIVTKNRGVKILPKEGTIFRFWVEVPDVPVEVPNGHDEVKEEVKPEEKKNLIFELHGDQFMVRPADRANRKFKPHFLKDL